MSKKGLKKYLLCLLCMLFLCVLIPSGKVKASVVKTTGYYNSTTYTAKYAKYIGETYLKKVKLSGNKLTIYGSLFYHKNKNYSSTGAGKHYRLKAHKRIFKLTKKTKYYWSCEETNWKSKRVSKKTAYKYMSQTDTEYYVTIHMKNKKVTSIDINYIM